MKPATRPAGSLQAQRKRRWAIGEGVYWRTRCVLPHPLLGPPSRSQAHVPFADQFIPPPPYNPPTGRGRLDQVLDVAGVGGPIITKHAAVGVGIERVVHAKALQEGCAASSRSAVEERSSEDSRACG